MEELKPCPFCGETDAEASVTFVYCNTCGAEGPLAVDEDEAEAIWNRRAGVTEVPVEGKVS